MANNIINFLTQNMVLSIIFLILLVIYIIFEVTVWFSSGSLEHQLKISVNQLILLFNHHKAVVIDVREEQYYAAGHIVGAINIPSNLCNYTHAFIKSNSNKPIIIVCGSGKIAAAIAVDLYKNGIKQATYLSGGLDAWCALDMPLIKSTLINNKLNLDNSANVENIVIYTKADCPYSVSAKNLLKSKGLAYKEILVTVDSPDFLNMVKCSQGARNTPQIFINNNHIGDLDALKETLKLRQKNS